MSLTATTGLQDDDLGFRPAVARIQTPVQGAADDGLGFRPAQPTRAAHVAGSDDDLGFRSAQTAAANPTLSATPTPAPPKPQGPTIGPAPEPSFFERMRSAIANSAIGHATEQALPKLADVLNLHPTETVYNPYEAAHAHEIIAPGAAFPKPGAAKGVAEFAGGLATPENVSILAATGGLGALEPIIGKAGATAMGRLISAGFSASMIQSAVEKWPGFKEAWAKKDMATAGQLATEALLDLGMSAFAARHATTEARPTLQEQYGATLDRSKAIAPEPAAPRPQLRAAPIITPAPTGSIPPEAPPAQPLILRADPEWLARNRGLPARPETKALPPSPSEAIERAANVNIGPGEKPIPLPAQAPTLIGPGAEPIPVGPSSVPPIKPVARAGMTLNAADQLAQIVSRYRALDAQLRTVKAYGRTKEITTKMRELSAQRAALEQGLGITRPQARPLNITPETKTGTVAAEAPPARPAAKPLSKTSRTPTFDSLAKEDQDWISRYAQEIEHMPQALREPEEAALKKYGEGIGNKERLALQLREQQGGSAARTPLEGERPAELSADDVEIGFRPTGSTQAAPRFGSRAREELAAAVSTPADQSQALRTDSLRLAGELRNRPDAPAEERLAAQDRITQNQQMIEALERGGTGEEGFATLDLVRDVLSGHLPKEAWQQFVAGPLIEKGLGIGDKYAKVREADSDVAAGLHLLDNAPAYFRAKGSQTVQSIIGNLSREQERLFTLMADADSRDNLRVNHPQEFRQATNDPAIQEALRRYRPIEQQLTAARERLGGRTLDQDYLRRVYEQHVAGIGHAEAPGGSPERATTAFDRVIQPQKLGNMTREATAEYHYANGLHEFGPAFGTKYIATNLRSLEDQIARDFISKATELKPGDPEPRSISYSGEKYYRPDLVREMRDAGQKNVKAYDRYDPTAGVKYPQQGTSRFLGPQEVVRTLNDYGAGRDTGPGAVRRFLQEQVIGFGFGIPHVANILRRVTQSAPLGAANPEAWARAWKVAFSSELRDRGVKGLDDPTFDKLMQHGSITTGEMANLKEYWGGNLNPANWVRTLMGVGHKLIFEPGSFGGLGGVDQRARLYIADLVKSRNLSLTDEQIARAVNTQLGDYNRVAWTERQKTLSKFMLFPGWDTSSIRWVIEHPIKTTVPPALLIWTANQVLHQFGQNRPEDAGDITNIHWGDRSIGVSLLRESMARNLVRPLSNYVQSRVRGESGQRALGEAARGITQGAGGLVGMLRPDITAAIDLAMNRSSPFGGQELVSKDDYNLPGRILPNRALEKQAALIVRHAVPALDRMLGSDQEIDLRAFAGSNVGLPNYQQGAEQRLKRNTAETMEVSRTLSQLAKTNQATARQFIHDPDNAAYALFRNEFSEMSKTLKRIDDAKDAVSSAKNLSAAEKSERLASIGKARENLLRNADGLDALLFKRKQEGREKPPAPVLSH